MAASSTHADELALEAQEVLLAEQEDETPRLCSAHLHGTTAKSLLALTLVWLTACFVTVVLLKLDWQILLKCLPGCLFGFSSVLVFSYEEKQCQDESELPGCAFSALPALPQFCWLLLLPLLEMPWQMFTLEVAGTALGLLGLHAWIHSDGQEDDRDNMHNRWRKAGIFLQLIGLLVTWLGALPCLVQITWQVALCSLPFVGRLLLLVFDACTEGVPRYWLLQEIAMGALLLLYGMSLPMSGMWQWFLGLELGAYLLLCTSVCQWIWPKLMDDLALRTKLLYRERVMAERPIACFLCLCALPFGAFALITKLSCSLTAPLCQSWWPWVLFTPCALVTMYYGVEAVVLRHELKTAPSRAALLTRLLVIGALGLAPVVLATDVEGWQRGVEAPDMNPTTYLNVSLPVSLQNWSHVSMEIQKKQLHWLHMPRPLWPSKHDMASASTTTRSTFWLSYMGLKFMLASGMVLLILVLDCKCTSSNQSTGASPNPSMEGQPLTAETKLEEEPLTAEVELEEGQGEERAETMGFQDRHRLLMLFVILPIHLTIVIKVSCTAAFFGQLTPNTGLAYEGYDLCLTSGLLWIVAQALALRAEDFAAHYSPADVALTMLIVVPFLGDGFDSLKDAMLGALALRSQRIWLQCLGLAALSYLVILHGFLAQSSSNRLELQKSYLPMLFLKRKPAPSDRAAAAGTVQDTLLDGVWRKLLVQLYKQSTLSRQWAMILEDAPQGVLALLVSLADGFQTFTLVVNIAVPVLRITLAWWLHSGIAWEVADWLLQEALNAADAQQLTVCDDFVASLHRLQATFPDYDLWKHLKEKNAGCCEAATGKVQQIQSHVGLRLFVLLQQPIAEDEESTANRWEKLTELLNQCTAEQIQEAKANIARASVHLEPSELVLNFTATTILEAISKPEKVTSLYLNLEEKNLGPGGARVVGEAVAKFQQITNLKLSLSYNNIGTEGAKAVGDSLAKLEHITNLELRLNGNNIGAEGAKAVGDSLAKLEHITNLELWLNGNNIGAEGAKAVGDSLAKLEHITNLKLSLSYNNIGAEGAKAVGDSLAKLEHITNLELWLNGNNIGAEGAKAVGDSLAKLEHITNLKLWLDDNNIGAEGAKAVGDSLAKLEHITNLELWLRYNKIGAEGAKAVGDSLAKLEHITNLELSLDDNNIGAEGAKAVGDSLAKLEHITNLKLLLDRNNIGAEGAKAVGDSLAKLEHITNLELWLIGNKIGAEGAKAVGDSLAKLEHITNLELHGIPDEVVDEIRHQLQKPGRIVKVY